MVWFGRRSFLDNETYRCDIEVMFKLVVNYKL